MLNVKVKTSKLSSRYSKLEGERSSFLSRGKQYSKLTLPFLIPETLSGSSAATNTHGYQGIGAGAVNFLANKVTSALFPISEPFFAMDLDPDVEAQMLKEGGIDKLKLTTYFKTITGLAVKQMSKLKMRPMLVAHEKHLIVSGNSCLVFTDAGVKQLGLHRYVVKRDTAGNLLEVITKETIAFAELPNALKLVIRAKDVNKKDKDRKELFLYTGYCIDNMTGEYVITQSVDDIDVGEENRVPAEKLPIIVSRWNATSGEDYGRGLVEDHAGDFNVLEFLSEARARGAATMMDVKYLVKPGSLTDVDTLNSASTGDFVQGMPEDIVVFQLEKYADSKLIMEVMKEYQERIGRAFLMISTTIRDSERTTKYEVQKLANEIETSLGGVYSTQADELQAPIAAQLLDLIDPALITETFVPVIKTGLEALGRAREIEKLMQFSELLMVPASWPDTIQQRMKWELYVDMIASNLSLETSFLKTDDEMEKEQDSQSNKVIDNNMADAVAQGAGAAIGKRIGEGAE